MADLAATIEHIHQQCDEHSSSRGRQHVKSAITAIIAIALIVVSGDAAMAAAAAAAAPPAAASNRIDLAVGGRKLLAADHVTNFATSVEDVVHVKPTDDGRHLMLVAVKEGFTGLTLIYADGTSKSYHVHVGIWSLAGGRCCCAVRSPVTP